MHRTSRAVAAVALLSSLAAFAGGRAAAAQTPPAVKVPGLERYAPRDTSDGLSGIAATRCVDKSTLHLLAGARSYEAGRYAEAVEEFRQAVAKSPGGPVANYSLAVAYETAGRYEEAVDTYKTAIVANAGYDWLTVVIAHRNLGNVYAALGRTGDAVAEDEWVLALHSANSKAVKDAAAAREAGAKIYYNLALSYAAAGRQAAALRAFGRAAELKPDYAEARYNLGVAQLDAGDRDAAALQVRALETLDPALAERLKGLLR